MNASLLYVGNYTLRFPLKFSFHDFRIVIHFTLQFLIMRVQCTRSSSVRAQGSEVIGCSVVLRVQRRVENSSLWYTDKKEIKMFLIVIYKEIQSGAVAKSYMRKGFLIYEEMLKYFPIYEEAVSHI